MATAKMPDKITGDNSNQARKGEVVQSVASKPIAKGKMRSKTLAMKFADVFFEGSMKDAIDYMINDIAIPQIKNAVVKGIEVIFYGGANSSSNRGGSPDKVSYSSYYVSRDGTRRPGSSGSGNPSSRNSNGSELDKLKKSFDPKMIVVEDRGQAQRVLADLRNDCNEYGQIGVDRLFELVDITSDWTSTKYGWRRGDLDDAKVRPCGNGWWFDLPDPIVID